MKPDEPRQKVGYARVSTTEQNLDMQVAALIKAGVPEDMIFTDKMSGASNKRPGLKAALKLAQHTQTDLVVWKLDRLGRTLLGIMEIMQLMDRRSVRLVSITEGFDMGTPFGKAMVGFLAVFAELERNLIRERTIAGLKRAKEKGVIVGRRETMTPERVARATEMISSGSTRAEILAEMQSMEGPAIARSRVQRWCKDYLELNPEDPTDDR